MAQGKSAKYPKKLAMRCLFFARALTVHPFPILHPTTPHAFPLARTWSGKISAGYSHGIVSHVAPKAAVNTKVNEAEAAPNSPAFCGLLIAPLDKPPDRNIDMPITIAPQYSETRRPKRSSVKTAIKVENCCKSDPFENSKSEAHTMYVMLLTPASLLKNQTSVLVVEDSEIPSRSCRYALS